MKLQVNDKVIEFKWNKLSSNSKATLILIGGILIVALLIVLIFLFPQTMAGIVVIACIVGFFGALWWMIREVINDFQ